ncbi:MAG TPA: hypothetical protein VFV73_17790, partial [Streptosporangiaceae bacterium]|nr:hypothetical protein [Streptosporangiaceae bacterium]
MPELTPTSRGQAAAGQPGAGLAAAQEARQAAGAGEQGGGLAGDLLLQDVPGVRGVRGAGRDPGRP